MNNPFEEQEMQVSNQQVVPKKKKAKGIIIGVLSALIVIAVAIVIFVLFPREKHHFRNVDIGMTIAQVMAAEKDIGNVFEYGASTDYSVTNIKLYNTLVDIVYYLRNDSLEMITVDPVKESPDNNSDAYDNLFAGMEKQYGKDYEDCTDFLLWTYDDYSVLLMTNAQIIIMKVNNG